MTWQQRATHRVLLMFDIPKSNREGVHWLNRRDFLRATAMAPLALALPQTPGLESDSRGGAPRARSVILIYLGGGLSHIDSFDPKPEAPAEIRGKYRPISTSVPGLMIGELLPHISRCIDKLTLVRSASHDCDHHETATNWMLSGRFGSPFGDYPAMGAVAAHELGSRGRLPPYVAVPRNPSFTWELGTSAFLGEHYESLPTGNPAIGDQRICTFDRLRRRAATTRCDELGQAFAVEKESVATRDRYGVTSFGKSCLLARRLIERGVRFVTISFGGSDSHVDIWSGLERLLPRFDLGFSALIEDLHARGLLAETLVLVCGEFGRTPAINADAGRDHWAPAASLVFAGAGVRGGQAIGRTDRYGGHVIDRPVSPADVAFTVYNALGIDPHRQLTTPDGRRIAILDEGEVIPELYT